MLTLYTILIPLVESLGLHANKDICLFLYLGHLWFFCFMALSRKFKIAFNNEKTCDCPSVSLTFKENN